MKRRSRVPSACVAAVCAIFAACSVGPAYRRPDVALPQNWRELPVSTPGAAPASPSAPAWPAGDWWRSFGSARLDDLIVQAERSNDDLAAAAARIEEADAELHIAGAALLPTVDLGGSGTRERQFVAGEGPKVGNVFLAALSASYELDFWGRYRAQRDAARAAALGSRFDRETLALSVVSSVATTYFQALELRDRISVAQHNLANAQFILTGLQKQQAVGIVTALDVAQQETTVAQLAAAVPPLVQQFRQTVNGLAVLIGRAPQDVDIRDGTLTELSLPEIGAGLPSELLWRRPDVASAEEQLIAANADIRVARAALFPNIELTANGGYQSAALTSLVHPANRVYALSAGLTQPIFHGGALLGQYRYSKARYAELLANYHKTVLEALGNVDSALIAAQQTAEQQERQADAVSKANRAYEYSQAQFHAGTVNIITVLNTENALFSAQDALVQVRFARLQALVNLYNALGGGWRRET
jgi:NodT family efflux transporter outer membrane factor (OMF) lipoprotein